MSWQDIFKEIGIIGIIAGLLTWLIKELGMNIINKNLKDYEQSLNQKSELFKKELSLIAQKANKLHEKRIERIEEIYSLLTDFHNDMQNLISWKITTGMSKEEIIEQEIVNINLANDSGKKFFDYYSKNRLYFNQETCELIDEIIKLLKGSHNDFSYKYLFNLSPDMSYQNIQRANENIREKVPRVKKALEDNFRKIIGVD